ncbi:hypothetical protein P43SY_006810 [Pythium insidiosum]|uniref:HMG box domain-containing protein n=1 Tax=Pythium insidiosum TaxID=114742 RepID=A0AAD5M2Y8_PYTIN|nr:hypothetical protein P43SY_006810 [Pythium insidiosum]
MAVVKKPQSAYFIFSGEKRKEITEANPGLRVGEVQKLITARWKELTAEEKEKLITARWKELTAEEKEVYLDLAAKDKERYERELLENPVVAVSAEATDAIATVEDGHACMYPLGRVKRIIQSDPDVNKVSREALLAISKASVSDANAKIDPRSAVTDVTPQLQELFAQYLATKSYEQTLFNNKRQIKASDVARAIQTTPVLDWLRDDFPDMKHVPPPSKPKAAKPQLPVESRASATTFFRAGTDSAVAEEEETAENDGGTDEQMDAQEEESEATAESHN